MIKKKLVNFWYYHKTAFIIGVLVLAAGIYLLVQRQSLPQYDYTVALVSSDLYDEERQAALRAQLAEAGNDCNGDGTVMVELRYYRIDFTGAGRAGIDLTPVAQLDADLVGQVSGMFLMEDPAGLQEASHALCYPDGTIPPEDATDTEGMVKPLASGLYAALRREHPDAARYRALLDALQ